MGSLQFGSKNKHFCWVLIPPLKHAVNPEDQKQIDFNIHTAKASPWLSNYFSACIAIQVQTQKNWVIQKSVEIKVLDSWSVCDIAGFHFRTPRHRAQIFHPFCLLSSLWSSEATGFWGLQACPLPSLEGTAQMWLPFVPCVFSSLLCSIYEHLWTKIATCYLQHSSKRWPLVRLVSCHWPVPSLLTTEHMLLLTGGKRM